jgi:hypothetical protein
MELDFGNSIDLAPIRLEHGFKLMTRPPALEISPVISNHSPRDTRVNRSAFIETLLHIYDFDFRQRELSMLHQDLETNLQTGPWAEETSHTESNMNPNSAPMTAKFSLYLIKIWTRSEAMDPEDFDIPQSSEPRRLRNEVESAAAAGDTNEGHGEIQTLFPFFRKSSKRKLTPGIEWGAELGGARVDSAIPVLACGVMVGWCRKS